MRSQLARAHELLRAKLDAEHGERATWIRGALGILAPRDASTNTGLETVGSALGWSVAIGAGIAASVAGVLAVRAELAPRPAIETAALQPAAAPATPLERILAAGAYSAPRSPIASDAEARATALSGFEPADEPVELLHQSRQIKRLIVERRLAVSPEERARAGLPADTATSGVVRLLDRAVFGEAFDLPWMRGGGSYFSFSERVHDYNRRPQVELQQGQLSASFYGGSSALCVELGERRLADVPSSAAAPAWLDPARRFLWGTAHAEFDPRATDLRQVYAERSSEAVARGHLDEATTSALERIRRESVEARLDHSYLVRCVSSGEHDLVVAVEVIAVSPEQCTLAWKILESRPVMEPEPVRVLTVEVDAARASTRVDQA